MDLKLYGISYDIMVFIRDYWGDDKFSEKETAMGALHVANEFEISFKRERWTVEAGSYMANLRDKGGKALVLKVLEYMDEKGYNRCV